jgi:hypothetical protein
MTSPDKTSELIAQLDVRLGRVEEAIAGIGHNGGPPLDEEPLPSDQDQLLPTPAVAKRYGVSTRSISRWGDDPDLGFPKPEVIKLRKYWRVSILRAWDRARILKSMKGEKSAGPEGPAKRGCLRK